MNRRLLDTLALTVAVTLATGAVMLGSAHAPVPQAAGDEDARVELADLPTMGLVSWAMHAAETPVAPPPAPPAVIPLPLALDECRHEAERTLQQAAEAADRLVLESGSGAVRVDGRAGLTQVRVVARLCASEASYLESMDVTLERRGATLDLRTEYPEQRQRARWGDDYARIELVVEVPAGMDAEVDDGSGALELYDVGALLVNDGSGEIRVQGAGSVRIDDGSGAVYVRDVRGDVEIEDGSGEIDVDGVQGAVDITDGSGSITVLRARGNVEVHDGSGSIEVDGVGGDFVVRSDGSGSLDWSGVSGRVDVPEKHRSSRRSWHQRS